MNIEDYRLYCLSKKGVSESIPFQKIPNILVFKVLDKIFTATDMSTFDTFSIKCMTETIEELRAHYPSLGEPAYFSEKHSSRVVMYDTIPNQ